MTDVACFCGCLYSFDGGEGPCPKCGAVAAVGPKAMTRSVVGSPPEAAANCVPCSNDKESSLRLLVTPVHAASPSR